MAISLPHQECQINITVQGVQLTRTIEVTRSYPDNHCLSFVGIQAWRRNFHRRCECSVSDSRSSKNCPLVSQVVRLARFETGFVQKKWSESRIAGVILKHYVNGKNSDKSGPRREAVRLSKWIGSEVILYMCFMYNFNSSISPAPWYFYSFGRLVK